MAELTKEEIIADLYVLRSGLSSVSQCKDIIVQHERNAKSLDDKIDSNERQIQTISEEEEQIRGNMQQLNIACKDKANFLNNLTPPKKESDFKKTVLIHTLIPISILMFGLTCVIVLMTCKTYDNFKVPLLTVGSFLGIAVGGIWLIVGFFVIMDELKRGKKRYVANQNKLREEIAGLNLAYEAKNKELITKQETRRILEINVPILKEQRNALQEQCKAAINVEAEKSNLIYQGLKETYSDIILEADWKNTDLIIWYLQSGRADTLKEALYQADRQRQTDSIRRAIESAAGAVCREIHSGMRALGTIMVKGFERLSYQIDELNDSVTEKMDMQSIENEKLVNAISAQNEKLNEKLISAAELNNALLEKANESSDKLMYDLKYNQRLWLK